MKKVFLFILFAAAFAFAQNISVANKTELLNNADGKYYHPKFSPDGSKVLLTSENYTGLWLYDLNTKKIEQLNDFIGAGYEPVFSQDGKKVIFKADDYSNNLRESTIREQVLSSKEINILQSKGRDISSPKLMKDGKIVFAEQNKLAAVSSDFASSTNTIAMNEAVPFIENRRIAVYKNGEKNLLAPLGEENYIWASVSPDNSKLLFTAAGIGTFVSDLDGKILYEIGYANYPQWSADGNWIVYMQDEDDGHKYIASDIFVSSADGTKSFQLTNTSEEIEMFPDWSKTDNRVVYNTTDGKIYLLELNID